MLRSFVAILVFVVAIALGRLPVMGAQESSPGSRTVAVSLTEFMIDMPTELPAGPLTFDIANDGEIAHNFEVEGQGIEEELPENVAPGASATLELDLQPGIYEIYCPVGNHAAEGMRLELTVHPGGQLIR